jgi:hypothetical protein
MSLQLTLPITTEEEALDRITTFLRRLTKRKAGVREPHEDSHVAADGTPVFFLSDLFKQQLDVIMRERATAGTYSHDYVTNAGPYYDAVWVLISQGVLRPTVLAHQASVALVGTVFSVTGYGRSYIEREGNSAR